MGNEVILVSKRGAAFGCERRVIQNANGEAWWLKTRSEVSLNDVVGGEGRSITNSGMVYCWLMVSEMLTCSLPLREICQVEEGKLFFPNSPRARLISHLNCEVRYISSERIACLAL